MRRLLCLATAVAAAIPLLCQPSGVPHIALPADLSGTLDGTEYKIRVPANWNGILLVWGHGAQSGALQIAPPTFPVSSPKLEEQLLSRGFALAGSFYADSDKEGQQKTLALTNFFNGAVGNPRRTIVWGLSMGGKVALKLMENHPGIYDGGIAVAASGAGEMKRADDFLLRFDLAYAAAFGWPSDWWGPIENLRDDLYGNEATLIAPVFQWLNPGNYGQWEFIRLVMKEPPGAWWGVDPILRLPGWAATGWAGTAYRSRLESLSRGPVCQNIGVVYTLAPEEKAYLTTLGVNADQYLSWMNAHTNIVASRSARNHLEHYGTFTGDLRRPVVTMHGILDFLAIVSNEAVYRDLVAAEGKSANLVQVYVNTYHDAFSAEQYLSTVTAMVHWLDTGTRPDPSFFPESQGFQNSFVPPPWPY